MSFFLDDGCSETGGGPGGLAAGRQGLGRPCSVIQRAVA
jgi:hypothetical protein